MKADHYDAFAGSYARQSETGLFNAHYARPAMVALAQRRLGTDTKVLVADLAEPLPFSTEEFDDVVASLVLHYLED